MTEQFSPDSKIWVYQAERNLNDDELIQAKKFLDAFCREWTAHNQQLLAAADILYKRFIVLKVDETHTNASGCSIDKSVRALKDLGHNLDINLFNRMQVPYLENGSIMTVDFNHVEKALEEKKIDASTEFFDLNVSTLKQLQDRFIVPLRQHWAYPKV
jgi:hypothetical protein